MAQRIEAVHEEDVTPDVREYFADGFGKLVELLGLGDADQSCEIEV